MAQTSTSTSTSKEYGPPSRRIGGLKRERVELEEEILRLRAVVPIWTEVCRQKMPAAEGSEAFRSKGCSGELR